jgi:anaerobic ribonucleoside-triphosphate reductase
VPLAYGFTDYGQWYQGEITGNWIFGNSNQKTHMIKGSATLTDSVSVTASWLNFTLDEPGQIGVSDEAFGDEIDVFLDWQATDRLFLSAVAAVMIPGDGAEQFTGGDKTWSHIMFYASVAF